MKVLYHGVRDYQHGGVVHPGDRFGKVLAWLWETSPDSVSMFLADYMAHLRVHDDLVPEDAPKVRFEDVLGSLPLALPERFTDVDPLVARLREDVPKYFGNDLNS